MKLILKEYLSSLRERGDLDKSVLPNLLSEIGLRVLNTPMIGTRQNGVDIAAVGQIEGEDDQRYLYLFCIKAGNIKRSDWDGGPQAVRPELNEIRDTYLRSNVAKEHSDLPVKICLCCGGELEETVLMNWAGYTEANTTDKISYAEWNGDRVADLMMRSLLARELLEDEARRSFQKAVAMVNEPSACYEYTRVFIKELLLEEVASSKKLLLRLRQAYICLHAVTAWAIDAENLESTYRVSELGIFFCWNSVKGIANKNKKTKDEKALLSIFDQFLNLHLTASELYLSKTAYAHGKNAYALSWAVGSKEAVDVNLAMFEILGRLAIHGLWTHLLSKSPALTGKQAERVFVESTANTLDTLVRIINANPTLNSPIKDDHMIEIALVMYLAQITGSERRFLPWIARISELTTFELMTNSRYPTCLQDYGELLGHPAKVEQSYRDEACAGSVLYPFLFLWLHATDSRKLVVEFTQRLENHIPRCNHQAWFPDEETDSLIWRGERFHGICVTDLSPKHGNEAVAGILEEAVKTCTSINDVSAIKSGLIPLFLTACRHYRMPVPPNFWFVAATS